MGLGDSNSASSCVWELLKFAKVLKGVEAGVIGITRYEWSLNQVFTAEEGVREKGATSDMGHRTGSNIYMNFLKKLKSCKGISCHSRVQIIQVREHRAGTLHVYSVFQITVWAPTKRAPDLPACRKVISVKAIILLKTIQLVI